MELLLMNAITGLGKKYDIVEVEHAAAMKILSERKAFAATPSIRKRFGALILKRAEERSQSAA